MIRSASRLLLVLLCACLACEDEDDFRLEDRPSELEVCFAATLDILPESVASTNTTPSTRRHYDREPPWTLCPAAPYCFSVDLTGTGQLESDSTDAVVCADWLARLQYGPLTHRVDEDFYLDWQDAGTDVYAGVRELDSCAVRALLGSFDTRNDYRVELRDGGNFQMDLRGYHQAVVDGVPRTGFCHGSWTSTVMPRACE